MSNSKLSSKYVTKEGLTFFLKEIYDCGYRYIYHDPEIKYYMGSVNKPVFKDGEYINCVGDRIAISYFFSVAILMDIMKEHDYIDILDYIDIVDWSKVPMDANVYTETECAGPIREHFARYENGKVYLWANGKTSWTASSEDYVVSYSPKNVFLEEETD